MTITSATLYGALLFTVMIYMFFLSQIVIHACSHYALTGHRRLDSVLGSLLSVFNFHSFEGWRALHMLHHRYENTARDPDNMYAAIPGKGLRTIVYYAWYAVGMILYIGVLTATGPLRAEGWREKALSVAETVMMIGITCVKHHF